VDPCLGGGDSQSASVGFVPEPGKPPAQQPAPLGSAQTAVLERLLKAGFGFASFEHLERYPAVEKDGFAALLDPTGGRLEIFGQPGYRMGAALGVLIERAGKKVFVWKEQSVEATPELLEAYARFRQELEELLAPQA
jgi:hypothetical protein